MSDLKIANQISLSCMLSRGLIGTCRSAFELTYLLEVAIRELPEWLGGDHYNKFAEGVESAEMFNLQIENVKNAADRLWQFDEEVFKKVQKNFYLAFGHNSDIIDGVWDCNFWFMIRTIQGAAHEAAKDYGRWLDASDKASDSNCLQQLQDLRTLAKQANMLRDLAEKTLDGIYAAEKADKEEVKEEAPAAAPKSGEPVNLDDLF